jgi:hypothetical protein
MRESAFVLLKQLIRKVAIQSVIVFFNINTETVLAYRLCVRRRHEWAQNITIRYAIYRYLLTCFWTEQICDITVEIVRVNAVYVWRIK